MLEHSQRRRNVRRIPVRREWQDGTRRAILRIIHPYRCAKIDDPLKLRPRHSRVLEYEGNRSWACRYNWRRGISNANICTLGNRAESNRGAHIHTYSVGPRRRHSLFYVPSIVVLLRARSAGSHEWVERQRDVEVEGIDGHEELLSEIDTTEWVEIVEECAQSDMAREGDEERNLRVSN